MRLANMHTIEEENAAQEPKKETESSDEDEEDDEEVEARVKSKAPVLYAALIRHNGEVNRLKVSICLYIFRFDVCRI